MSPRESVKFVPLDAKSELAERVSKLLIATYTPPTIQLNAAFEPMQLIGDVTPYLQRRAIKANVDILHCVRPQLQTDLRKLLDRCAASDAPVVEQQVRFRFAADTKASTVKIIACKLSDIEGGAPGYLLTFKRLHNSTADIEPGVESGVTESESANLSEGREELRLTREHLHAVIAELQLSLEEAQALSEKLEAAHEQLRASSEEAQRANTELQTTKLALMNVNDSLQAKSTLLSDTSEALANMLQVLDIAMVMVDADQRVTRFTPQTEHLFDILADDIGHKLTKLKRHFDVDDLGCLVDQVINSGSVVQRQVVSSGERYRMSISPVLREHSLVSGAILTFTKATAA